MKRTVFAVMLLAALVGCSGFGQPTPQPLPTVVLNGPWILTAASLVQVQQELTNVAANRL